MRRFPGDSLERDNFEKEQISEEHYNKKKRKKKKA